MIPVGWPSFYAERGWADIVKSAIFAGVGHVTQVRIVLFFLVYDSLRDMMAYRGQTLGDRIGQTVVGA